MSRERLEITLDELNETKIEFVNFLFKKLKEKGNHTFSSRHEILGAITEEYHELIEEVTKHSNHQIKHELFDLAVCALFGACCIDHNKTDW